MRDFLCTRTYILSFLVVHGTKNVVLMRTCQILLLMCMLAFRALNLMLSKVMSNNDNMQVCSNQVNLSIGWHDNGK